MSSEISAEDREDVFYFLDDLRDSGVTNMFGAVPYIQDEFGYDRTTSKSLLSEWMKTYDVRHP
jgi:hypothetical protein